MDKMFIINQKACAKFLRYIEIETRQYDIDVVELRFDLSNGVILIYNPGSTSTDFSSNTLDKIIILK